MSAMDAFWAAPPVTRTICAAAVALSISVYSGLLSPYYVVFLRPYVFQLWTPQLWRLLTPFLLTGPKLGMLLDPYFLFTYGKALETESSRFSQPGEFVVFLIFICSFVVLTAGVFLNGMIFLQPLILALAYLYAQENPTARMTFYIVTFQIKYLPYCMLAMTFVMDSPEAAMMQATGLLAAHLYDFLTRIWPAFGGGQNPLSTPQFISKWFATGGGPGTSTARGAGTAFQARPAGGSQSAAAPSAGGWTSGFSGNGWGNRGPGRRLGGE